MKIPAHLTGFWVIHEHKDPYRKGSTGAGLVVWPGVEIRIKEQEYSNKTKLVYNNIELNVCPLKKILGDHTKIYMKAKSPYMIGEGYAASAAIALAASITRQLVEKGHYNILQAAAEAHKAEVECLTGLGDIIAIIQGGYLEVRTKPGAPGIGEVVTIPINEKLVVITAKLSNTITMTPKMLVELRDRINKLGSELVEKLLANPTIEEFLELSHEFTTKLGIVNGKVIDNIEQVLRPLRNNGTILGYYYKKKTLVVVCEEQYVENVLDSLGKLNLKPITHRIVPNGIQIYEIREEQLIQ